MAEVIEPHAASLVQLHMSLQQVTVCQARQQHSGTDGSRHHCPFPWLQSCRGFAPQHTTEQQHGLQQALAAARYVLGDCFSRLWDSRLGVDLVPWMLQVTLGCSVIPAAPRHEV